VRENYKTAGLLAVRAASSLSTKASLVFNEDDRAHGHGCLVRRHLAVTLTASSTRAAGVQFYYAKLSLGFWAYDNIGQDWIDNRLRHAANCLIRRH